MLEIRGISSRVSTYTKLKKEIDELRERLGLYPLLESDIKQASQKNKKRNRDIRKSNYRFEHPIYFYE